MRTPPSGRLRCPGGTTRTPGDVRVREHGPYYPYICWRARHDSDHQARSKITERKLLPWIRAEAARMHVPHGALAPDEQEGRREANEGGLATYAVSSRKARMRSSR